jgi:uncharacterized protein YgiM (DUF1202 family)
LQTARTKTVDLSKKSSVSKFQAQKTKYPAEALPAAETANKAPAESMKGTVIVAVETANMRNKPFIDADKVAWVSKGSSLKVLDESQDASGRVWYEVRLADGRECWISKRVVR